MVDPPTSSTNSQVNKGNKGNEDVGGTTESASDSTTATIAATDATNVENSIVTPLPTTIQDVGMDVESCPIPSIAKTSATNISTNPTSSKFANVSTRHSAACELLELIVTGTRLKLMLLNEDGDSIDEEDQSEYENNLPMIVQQVEHII